MGFVCSLEELKARQFERGEFYDAEMLTVYFETYPDNVAKLIPPPLKPGPFPMGLAFVAHYPKTNFSPAYHESALFLMAAYGGVEGLFCLAMPVDDDTALILGREVFGYPKKMAHIHLEREGNDFRGGTQRHGVPFLEMKARLEGTFNDPGAQQLIVDAIGANPDLIIYNFKFFPNPERNGFDYHPRLVRETVTRRIKTQGFGEAQLVFNDSSFDPWSDVEIVKIYGATYTVADATMLPGEVVAEADPLEFAPFALMKMDVF
jgi:acetoacetate decarboxylase